MTVTFEDVTKIYQGNKPAVEKLNLEVNTGELLVLIGPSGCGKTTTLRMVNRLEEPTQGKIQIDGRQIEKFKEEELRRGIGYTVQQTGLFPHLTIKDNIEVVPRLLKWSKEKRDARVRELLALVNMDYEEFANRYPRQLSGGQQQRIGVLRSLAADPPIILMDEPFGALDPISREVLQIELKKLQSRLHKTIIFVTHDIDEAIRLGDRIAIFQSGKLVQLGSPQEIVNHPANEFVASFIKKNHQISSSNFSLKALDLANVQLQPYRSLDDQIVMSAEGSNDFYLVDHEQRLQGIVSKESVLKNQWHEVKPLQVIKESDSVQAILIIFKEVNALPVVDDSNKLKGVITSLSLMDALARLVGGNAS
jgi:osmoprotectant transport system ATP-binding protein